MAAVKSVLAVYYSQSGQMRAVMDRVLAPVAAARDIKLTRVALEVEPAFPYPWPFWRFLDAFPETVALMPPPLKPLPLRGDERFDLIVLGYPVWFLSPVPAMTAFLQSSAARAILRGSPVVTVTACRNMWLMAQQTVKELLVKCESRLVDHVALVDRGPTLATFITTPRWLLTGRKDAFWGLPAAGVDEAQIRSAERFGRALVDGLRRGAERSGESMMQGLGACAVNVQLIASERIGLRSFRLWGAALRALGPPGGAPRRLLLVFYMLFLLAAIITIVPLNMLLARVTAPLLGSRRQRQKRAFEEPSGSDISRLAARSAP